MSEQVKWFDYKGHEVPADSGAAMFVKGITYHALHAEAEALRDQNRDLRIEADGWFSRVNGVEDKLEALRAENGRLQAELSGALTGIATEAQAADHYRTELEAAQGLLRDIFCTCNLREMPSEHAIRDISNRIEALLTATTAPEVPDHLRDSAEMVEQGERQEAVLIQAVAVTREDDEEGLRLEWLLEGGISELEFAGQVLFTMPEANDLCDEDGSAYLYRAPQPSQDVRALVEALEHARLFIRNGVELGYVKMPDTDTPDPAHETLPKIEAALASHRQAQRQA
jgi:hypothetical protein